MSASPSLSSSASSASQPFASTSASTSPAISVSASPPRSRPKHDLVIPVPSGARRLSTDSTSSSATGATKKSKWVFPASSPRGRSKSVTLSSHSSSGSASTSPPPPPVPPPGISLSPSSSAGSHLSSLAEMAVVPSPGLAVRSRSDRSREVLDDWADASLSAYPSPHQPAPPADRDGSLFREGSLFRGGKGRFTLRRKGSSLKLFGGGRSTTPDDQDQPNLQPILPGELNLPSSAPLLSSTQPPSASPNQPVTNRIGGWFTSMLNHSSSPHLPSSTPTPATTPSPSSQPPPHSPVKRFGPLDRILDRAAQYFLDGDSAPDFDPSEIWLLGVRHDGHIPLDSSAAFLNGSEAANTGTTGKRKKDSGAPDVPGAGWPAEFYADFYSRIGLTYRTGFPAIPCSPSSGSGGILNTLSMSIGRGSIAGRGTNEEGLSSDTGWGCMLRTGQSVLANALANLHLGRDFRRPLPTAQGQPTSNDAYARLVSLFLDSPSPLAPFSVHHFALQGKILGKEVGEWFGPSTAAGAIKALVQAYPEAGLGVVEGRDGTVYKSDVRAASGQWKRPVLVLLQVRLGIDGVNPIYFEAVKTIFQFPQSVGIAGGRPSSSYYFVGSQSSSLFYIDPHHPRPSIAFVTPPSPFPSPDWYASTYDDKDLRSYHSEKVRKMPLTSLDPSMLLGFLVRDEMDWEDFVHRSAELAKRHTPIFALADAPPAWMLLSHHDGSSSNPTDSDRGVESFSEPDDEWLSDTPNPALVSPDIAGTHSLGLPRPSPSSRGWDEDEDEDEDDERDEMEEDWPTPTRSRTDARPTSPLRSFTVGALPPSLEDSSVIVITPVGTEDESMVLVPSTELPNGTTGNATHSQDISARLSAEDETSPSLVVAPPTPINRTQILSSRIPVPALPTAAEDESLVVVRAPAFRHHCPPASLTALEDESPILVPSSLVGGRGVLVADTGERSGDGEEDSVQFEKKDGGWEGVNLRL